MIDVAEAARRLMSARVSGTRISRLPPFCRPTVNEESYAIQDEITKHCGPVGGWKVGRMAADQPPFLAPIYSDCVFAGGTRLPDYPFRNRLLEVEVGFRLVRDIAVDADGAVNTDSLAASLCFVPIFEVLDSRYASFPDLPLPELLADANGNDVIVLGEVLELPVAEPRVTPANLIVDGNALPSFSARCPLNESMALVAWLFHYLSRTGRTLSVGDFVTTGSVITPVPIKSRAHLDWGPLGTMQLHFGTGPQ